MNIILFTEEEISKATLPASDRRAQHMMEVLGLKAGESFTMGVIEGPLGEGQLLRQDESGLLHLGFKFTKESPQLFPITLFVGLPRPQMAKRIIREATTLGVQRMVFFNSERGIKSYAQSPIWAPDKIRELLWEGAEQAVSTRLPQIQVSFNLRSALAFSSDAASCKVACDNEEATTSLVAYASALQASPLAKQPIHLVIGAERGFSHTERDLLRTHGFTLASLGSRILRTETACLSALVLLMAGEGYLE